MHFTLPAAVFGLLLSTASTVVALPTPASALVARATPPDGCYANCGPGRWCAIACPDKAKRQTLESGAGAGIATPDATTTPPPPPCQACGPGGCRPIACPPAARDVADDTACAWDCGPPCLAGKNCPTTCVYRCDAKKRGLIDERAPAPTPAPMSCCVSSPDHVCPDVVCDDW